MTKNDKIINLLNFINENEIHEWGYWEWEIHEIVTKLQGFNQDDWIDLKSILLKLTSYQQNCIADALGELNTTQEDTEILYGEIFLNTTYIDTIEYLLQNLVNIGTNQSIDFYMKVLKRLEYIENEYSGIDFNHGKRHKEWIIEIINNDISMR